MHESLPPSVEGEIFLSLTEVTNGAVQVSFIGNYPYTLSNKLGADGVSKNDAGVFAAVLSAVSVCG